METTETHTSGQGEVLSPDQTNEHLVRNLGAAASEQTAETEKPKTVHHPDNGWSGSWD